MQEKSQWLKQAEFVDANHWSDVDAWIHHMKWYLWISRNNRWIHNQELVQNKTENDCLVITDDHVPCKWCRLSFLLTDQALVLWVNSVECYSPVHLLDHRALFLCLPQSASSTADFPEAMFSNAFHLMWPSKSCSCNCKYSFFKDLFQAIIIYSGCPVPWPT